MGEVVGEGQVADGAEGVMEGDGLSEVEREGLVAEGEGEFAGVAVVEHGAEFIMLFLLVLGEENGDSSCRLDFFVLVAEELRRSVGEVGGVNRAVVG